MENKYQRILDLNIIPRNEALALLEEFPNGSQIKDKSLKSKFLRKIYNRNAYLNKNSIFSTMEKSDNLINDSESLELKVNEELSPQIMINEECKNENLSFKNENLILQDESIEIDAPKMSEHLSEIDTLKLKNASLLSTNESLKSELKSVKFESKMEIFRLESLITSMKRDMDFSLSQMLEQIKEEKKYRETIAALEAEIKKNKDEIAK